MKRDSKLVRRWYTSVLIPRQRPSVVGTVVVVAITDMEQSTHSQKRSSWTCDSVTISYASRRGTNRCRRCKGFMAQGELRFGVRSQALMRNLSATRGRCIASYFPAHATPASIGQPASRSPPRRSSRLLHHPHPIRQEPVSLIKGSWSVMESKR